MKTLALILLLTGQVSAEQSSLEQCHELYLSCAQEVIELTAQCEVLSSLHEFPPLHHIDIIKLPKFKDAALCWRHLGACGYTRMHYHGELAYRLWTLAGSGDKKD